MLATIVHRGLTVWIDPVARSARIQVHMPGRPDEHVVLVQPADGGWTVVDDREDEPIWFGVFEQALGEALSCGALALEDRLIGELRSGRDQALGRDGRGGQGVELLSAPAGEPPWPTGLP
ncbi:MAG: hypothetical protein U0893_01175 [Chloroflexota bacterium]